MIKFLEKLCCCCSIKIGGYILGIAHIIFLPVLIYVGFELAEDFDIGVDVLGRGEHDKFQKM